MTQKLFCSFSISAALALAFAAHPAHCRAGISDPVTAQFNICTNAKRINCVVDGDTLWFRAQKIRIADIDTPEIFSPRCEAERRLGHLAKNRLLTLLNKGSFRLVSGKKDIDHYGRQLRVIYRAGQSIGKILIEQKLARQWTGSRESWCS